MQDFIRNEFKVAKTASLENDLKMVGVWMFCPKVYKV